VIAETRSEAISVVFYDGVCGLCNGLIRFLLPRDRRSRLRFAALQSSIAQEMLSRYQRDSSDLDTMYVIADWRSPRERLLERSRAFFHTLDQLGGGWRIPGRIGSIVPLFLADFVYRLVAGSRYRIFGRFDQCALPPPEWRGRFLDGNSTESSANSAAVH
jgi:predicted DCC family thiol-disulfide oxidoreductase YuxK